MKLILKIFILTTILVSFFVTLTNYSYAQGSNSNCSNGLCSDISTPLEGFGYFGNKKDLGPFITNIVNVAFIFGAITTLIWLIWGGIEWTTSGGDSQKYESARNKIMSAIVGLAILASTWAIWLLILYFLGFQNMQGFNVSGSRLGGGSSSSSQYDCSPFPSCQAWEDQFYDKHGRYPNYKDDYNALVWSREQDPNNIDWLNYYCANNNDPETCANR